MAVIDLSQLPPPDVVEALDYEAVLAERKERLVSLYPAEQQADMRALLQLESEPIVKLLEENAYRELLLRQRVNTSARAVMLAYAKGGDLDQLGANLNVKRLVVTPADPSAMPPVDAVMERDEDYVERILLSFESYSTAGSRGSYEYWARSASAQVKNAQAVSPVAGQVTVYVLSRTDNGTADEDLLALVTSAVNAETVRPLTDQVTVLSASILPYTIEAELVIYPGPDGSTLRDAAQQAAQAFADSVHRIGADVARSGVYRALHQPGVKQVNLSQPLDNIPVADGQAAYCTAINLTVTVAEDE